MTIHNRRTRARANGFTLMELLIVISIMLILMLIAIPNFRSMTMTANELSAKNSLQAIYKAEIQYQTAFPANGFTCSLAALGGDRKAGPPTPTSAQVLEGDLATTGVKSGYTFALTNCSKQTVGNTDRYDSFTVTAVPLSVGKTGHAGFCIDEYADIKSDPTGGTNCTQPVQ